MAKSDDSNGAYELLKCADKITAFDNKVVIHFDWVKWYEDYASVRFIVSFLHNEADGYGFVEIGENEDDITSSYFESEDGTSFYEDVEVSRKIEIPDGEKVTLQ
ncbi:MAG: hypothetical protein RR365_10815 [Bacteroides sp.]